MSCKCSICSEFGCRFNPYSINTYETVSKDNNKCKRCNGTGTTYELNRFGEICGDCRGKGYK